MIRQRNMLKKTYELKVAQIKEIQSITGYIIKRSISLKLNE
jgi:hypothetical protein